MPIFAATCGYHMDYCDAIHEIIEKASGIKLPGRRLDVVTAARREFAKHGGCDYRLIEPIERVMKDCLRLWTREQKRAIWESTETGAESTEDFDAHPESCIDLDLEGELMYEIIEELSPPDRRNEGRMPMIGTRSLVELRG